MTTLVFAGTNDTGDVIELANRFDHVYLFEPIKELAQSVGNKLINHPDAKVFSVACGSEDGEGSFNIMNRRGLSSSLGLPTEDARRRYPAADFTIKEKIQVPIVHLGNLLRHYKVTLIDHVRIDAQGMDLTILKTIEPWLKEKQIKTLRTEADANGFQHYEGLNNSLEQQKEYMGQFGYEGYLVTHRNTFNPDVDWHGNINWQ